MATKELTKSEKIVKDYLDNYAKEDEAFAKSYAKENKSFEECLKYIKQEARKQAQKGCAMIAKEEVFGWAVHYYDEDDIEVNQNIKANMTAVPNPEPKEATADEVPEKKRAPRQSRKKAKTEDDPNIPEPLEIPLL